MLNDAPNKWTIDSIAKYFVDGATTGTACGKWEPARPIGFYSLQSRIRLAWAVFTGRADALFWPNQERQ